MGARRARRQQRPPLPPPAPVKNCSFILVSALTTSAASPCHQIAPPSRTSSSTFARRPFPSLREFGGRSPRPQVRIFPPPPPLTPKTNGRTAAALRPSRASASAWPHILSTRAVRSPLFKILKPLADSVKDIPLSDVDELSPHVVASLRF